MSSRRTEAHREAHRRRCGLGFRSANHPSGPTTPFSRTSFAPRRWGPRRLVVSVPVLLRCFRERTNAATAVRRPKCACWRAQPRPRSNLMLRPVGASAGAGSGHLQVFVCLLACLRHDAKLRRRDAEEFISQTRTSCSLAPTWPLARTFAANNCPLSLRPPPDHPLPCSPTFQCAADLMG
jgi:hypothetical protein